MLKKLARTGNGVALVLDKEILEATGLDAGSTGTMRSSTGTGGLHWLPHSPF